PVDGDGAGQDRVVGFQEDPRTRRPPPRSHRATVVVKRIAVALVLIAALTSCGHKTVRRTTNASSSPGASASASSSASPGATPEASRGAFTTGGPVTPRPEATYTTSSGANGEVVAGPTCPVERVGHPCPKRQVTDATVT